MLPKENRLLFRAPKKKSAPRSKKRYPGPLFDLVSYPKLNDESICSQFGFVVSARVSKKATQRNRIKRLLREAVRENLEKIRSGFSVVFLVKPQSIDKERAELKSEVFKLLQKADLIKK